MNSFRMTSFNARKRHNSGNLCQTLPLMSLAERLTRDEDAYSVHSLRMG